MEVTDKLVDELAHLSRLRFEEHEKEEIKQDLQRMISFIEKLNELDTTGVDPLLHMTEAVDVYREDKVAGSMERQDALANAPAAKEDYFTVPKVIRK